MKKLLMIGAGFLQSYVIRKAKALGYWVEALDGNRNAVGFQYADNYSAVDIVNPYACLRYAENAHIDGGLTVATDYGVVTTSYIAEKLGLPGLNLESAALIKNKFRTRSRLLERKIDGIDQIYEIRKNDDISTLRKSLRYPVMVKPCDGSGSRGACMVSCEGELEQACRNAIGLSHIGSAIVESYIGGSEYGAEAIVIDGIPHVLAIIKKQMTEPPFYAELGHTIPNDLDSEVEANAIRLAENVIRALGINFGAVNMDLKISTSGEVHLVDIGARMGGNMIGSHIIPYGTGIDYMKGIICSAMGDSVNLSAGEKKAIASKLLAFRGGVVRRLPDFVALEREYEVEIHHHLSIGDIVHSYRSNLDGCGYVIACGGDAEDVQRRAAFVRDKIEEYIFQES